jgi:hypothetical protein
VVELFCFHKDFSKELNTWWSWPRMVFFNLHTKNSVFIFTQHIISYLGITPCVKVKKKTPLTWKADVLLMVANPHPLWSLAWYQLPSLYFPISPHPFPPL